MVAIPANQSWYRVSHELRWSTLENRHRLGYHQRAEACRPLLLLPHGLVLGGRLGRQPVRTQRAKLYLQQLLGLSRVSHRTSSPLERVRRDDGSARHRTALTSPRLTLLVRTL